MPIYEYQSVDPTESCGTCRDPFEVIQAIHDEPLSACPDCGCSIVRIISWCRAVVVEQSEMGSSIQRKIEDYEKQGMWSHAAELSDTYAQKTNDEQTKSRALENYAKAGYDVDSTLKSDT